MRIFHPKSLNYDLAVALSALVTTSSALDYEAQMKYALAKTFSNDSSARTLLVRHYNSGDYLLPTESADGPIVSRAREGVTVVKLFIRTNGPAPETPSPDAGTDVGLEMWFPDRLAWNGRIFNFLDGGFQGNPQVTDAEVSAYQSMLQRQNAVFASESGYVVATTDGGHANPKGLEDMQYLLNANGSWNLEGWKNIAWQSTHLLSVHSKALAAVYYGEAANYTYLYGCSTGGRAVYQSAQMFPGDYDGLLASCPSITQSRLFPSLGHPYIVTNNDLGNQSRPTETQLEIISQRALGHSDTEITGQHDGYFSTTKNPYDPTKDLSIISTKDGGNCTEPWALSRAQCQAINKVWYGPTLDGSVPDAAVSNGAGWDQPQDQIWWGKIRGTKLSFYNIKRKIVGNYLAVVFKDPSLAPADWNHPLGPSSDAWDSWSHEKYAQAMLEAQRLDREVFHMDADNPADMAALGETGAKMITYHSFADAGVAPQSAMAYFHKSSELLGSQEQLNDFHRLFLVPGQDHCSRSAGVAGSGNPPIPTVEEWLEVLVTWVEQGSAPRQITAHSVDNKLSRPICNYPNLPKYNGHGDISLASSYIC